MTLHGIARGLGGGRRQGGGDPERQEHRGERVCRGLSAILSPRMARYMVNQTRAFAQARTPPRSRKQLRWQNAGRTTPICTGLGTELACRRAELFDFLLL